MGSIDSCQFTQNRVIKRRFIMEIKGQKIVLRDYIKEDIEDRIRWETIETEWLEWDAPWEMDEAPFNPDDYRSLMNERLAKNYDPKRLRYGFQICLNNETQKHIGWVNAYFLDDDYRYTKHEGKLAIGIDIPDMSARRRGYATEAWSLYISYLFDNGLGEIYTQTWSGNIRVLGLIKKMGFVECDRKIDLRVVREKQYDGLTFKLKLDVNQFYYVKSDV